MPLPSRSNATRALVLLSGGLDSAFNLAAAVNVHSNVCCLTFDYGQKARKAEIKAARALSRYYGVDHDVVPLRWLAPLSPPYMTRDETYDGARLRRKDLWIPNRNGVFIAVGAAYAEAAGIEYVVVGFNAEEAETFPDNSTGFIRASNKALSFSTRKAVTVKCYSTNLNKAGIVKAGDLLGVPWKLVYPCYGPGPRPCGRCPSCRRAAAAFRATGRHDVVAALFGPKSY